MYEKLEVKWCRLLEEVVDGPAGFKIGNIHVDKCISFRIQQISVVWSTVPIQVSIATNQYLTRHRTKQETVPQSIVINDHWTTEYRV